MAALSKVWVCSLSLAGIASSNPAGDMDALRSAVCCEVEISAPNWSLVRRSPAESGVSNRVWSWSLDNEETPAHCGADEPGKRKNNQRGTRMHVCKVGLVVSTESMESDLCHVVVIHTRESVLCRTCVWFVSAGSCLPGTDCVTDWLTDWLTDLLTNWLTDLLTNWLTD